MAAEIDAYRAGGLARATLLNRLWGLYTAAEIREPSVAKAFKAFYLAASTEDDRLRLGLSEDPGSEERFEAALSRLREWVVAGGIDR